MADDTKGPVCVVAMTVVPISAVLRQLALDVLFLQLLRVKNLSHSGRLFSSLLTKCVLNWAWMKSVRMGALKCFGFKWTRFIVRDISSITCDGVYTCLRAQN